MADRDTEIRLGAFSERAERLLASGGFTSIHDVVKAALDALDREEAAIEAIYREKVIEALADPGPSIPIEQAFAILDARKARRRKAGAAGRTR